MNTEKPNPPAVVLSTALDEHDLEYEVLASHLPRVVVTSLRDNPNYVKCPRCWYLHTIKENHDCLCDRCCNVMLEAWPNHAATPLIRENMAAQREKYGKHKGCDPC